MTDTGINKILEDIYVSLKNDNEDIDTHIQNLKAALVALGQKSVMIEPTKLVQNNRQGRKTMQSYFKKRGVAVVFSEE